MSIIIAAGNCNEVVVMSDGRWSGTGPNGERIVINENFKKIKKIHDKLFIAFAGYVDDCDLVISGVSKIISGSPNVEQYTSAVIKWIDENSDYQNTDFNAQII